MGQFLFYYQRPEPATWVYLSSFLVIGLFFMFHRIFSVRNLDVALLILLTPGLMMVYEGRKKGTEQADAKIAELAQTDKVELQLPDQQDSSATYVSLYQAPITAQPDRPSSPVVSPGNVVARKTWSAEQLQYWGYMWLLSVCGLLLTRMLVDTAMVRRPLLDPNLSIGGMSFIGASLFLFLMANILIGSPDQQRMHGGRLGPGYALLNKLPDISNSDARTSLGAPPVVVDESKTSSDSIVPTYWRTTLARVLAMIANLVIGLGIVAIGYFHFDNIRTGVGAATLFFLLPYTAQATGRLDHMIPGSLLIVAVLTYRQPVLSGFFLGCASGLVYYPFFLLPLWLSYYWQRGLRRYLIGFSSALAFLTVALLLIGNDSLIGELQSMYGIFPPAIEGLQGIWGLGWHPYFRLPVMVAFILLSFSFIFWPAQKNLATLLSCSAGIMIAAQFWHGYGGGLYMAWYLPLFMLAVFRPNLDHSVAMQVVRPMSRKSKRSNTSSSAVEENLAQAG